MNDLPSCDTCEETRCEDCCSDATCMRCEKGMCVECRKGSSLRSSESNEALCPSCENEMLAEEGPEAYLDFDDGDMYLGMEDCLDFY